MADPFAAYADAAHKQMSHPSRLIGAIKTRAEAKGHYAALVGEIHACANSEDLEILLLSKTREIKQFHAELEWFWAGDGADFLGLEKEIEWARARLDDRLDLPRWEPANHGSDLSYFEQGKAR